MKWLVALAFTLFAAVAQAQVPVTVIGPVTAGDCAFFNSTTVLKDAGFLCNAGGPGNAITALTGDGTAAGPGSVSLTLATVNATVGTFGSATQCITFTVNGKGLVTAASAATCTPAVGSITGLGTGVSASLATNTNASGGIITATPTRAGDIIFWNGSSWTTLAGNNAGSLVLTESAAGVPSWSAAGSGSVQAITPGAGLVSSLTTACSQGNITVTGTLSQAECSNVQTGTSYAIADSDRGKYLNGSNAAAQAYTIAQAGAASSFVSGWFVDIDNNSSNVAGIITITPTTSTINGLSTYKLYPGMSGRLVSDGSNYQFFNISPAQGQWTLLNVLTASASATLPDTTNITAQFTEYEIVLEQILPATTNVTVEFQMQVGGTFQTTTYLSSEVHGNGSAAGSTTVTSGIMVGLAALTINTAPGISGRYLLSNPSQTLTCKMLFGDFSTVSTTIILGTSGGCYNGGSGAITGIQLITSSGNITSGTMKIYGRVK